MAGADTETISTQQWFGYPTPKEGPNVPFIRKEDKNPLLRGRILVAVAWLVSKFQFLQFILWKNAGFTQLRELKVLADYSERWDPTVVPLASGKSDSKPIEEVKSVPDAIPGQYLSAAQYHALYKAGKLTPLAVAESLLPLIRRDTNPPGAHSVAFISCNPEQILEAAKESTLRYQNGISLGVLDGVPTGVKDECAVEGYRTTTGCKKNDALFPVADETLWAVQKWQEAGVIVMGKLNMHELGADTTNNNPNWGTPRNPHNDQYYPGGSSGGSAYAVAAGLIPFSLGYDGGGSIRLPSSFCGIYGLKPSHNRVENTSSTVTDNGPLAARMADLETAYRIMATPNPYDPICAHFSPPQPLTRSRPKVLGIYQEWFDQADPIVHSLCTKFVDYCEKTLGYTIVPISIPYCAEGQCAHSMTILAELCDRARAPSPKNWLSMLTPANQILLGTGTQTPASDYLLAQKLRNLLMRHLAFLFKKHPGLIIVAPTTPLPGWEIGKHVDLDYGVLDANKSLRSMRYVWLANFTGMPGISCPVGYADPKQGEGKVPIGIMGCTEWGGEESLIEWGKEAEEWLENQGGGRKMPKNWVDVLALANAGTSASE